MSSAAARMREHRRRAAAGKCVLLIERDLERLAAALREDAFLKADWDEVDKGAVIVALHRMLDTRSRCSARVTGNGFGRSRFRMLPANI